MNDNFKKRFLDSLVDKNFVKDFEAKIKHQKNHMENEQKYLVDFLKGELRGEKLQDFFIKILINSKILKEFVNMKNINPNPIFESGMKEGVRLIIESLLIFITKN